MYTPDPRKMKSSSSESKGNPENNHRSLYQRVAKHWQDELINSDTSDEWLTQHSSSSPSIVRKLIMELKQKSEVCHELLRTRLSDLNLALKEDEAFTAISKEIHPYGLMGKLEELYTNNSMLTGRSEELIAKLRGVQDDRTASLMARMRNIQLERHQLYSRFFQPGHVAFEKSTGFSGQSGLN